MWSGWLDQENLNHCKVGVSFVIAVANLVGIPSWRDVRFEGWGKK